MDNKLTTKDQANQWAKDVIENGDIQLVNLDKIISEACREGKFSVQVAVLESLSYVKKMLKEKGYYLTKVSPDSPADANFFNINWDGL